jgi:triphosphoribosyl-dephospho-CoA synthase
LVSLRDNGAHRDMNAATFMRSLFALRHYFAEIAIAGMRAARMAELRRLGVAPKQECCARRAASTPIAAPSLHWAC